MKESMDEKEKVSIYKVIAINYATACVSATFAETVTFPLDLTKTRLQIQGEIASSRGEVLIKRGMFRMAVGVVKEEGILQLWQGLQPALYRHYIYTGARMGVYEQVRENVFGKNPDGSFPTWKAACSGLLAGCIGQFVASPMDLVKVQMQMEGRRKMDGKSPRFHSVLDALQKTFKKGGVRGLWAGWVPNVQRAGLVNMGDLATYDTVKQILLKNTDLEDNWVCHGMSSGCSCFVAAVLGTPADVVKTRIMNQPRDENGVGRFYRSSFDCVSKTIRKEGFFSLYKGFIPIWSRMAPWSLTFWLTWEEIRKLAGSSSF